MIPRPVFQAWFTGSLELWPEMYNMYQHTPLPQRRSRGMRHGGPATVHFGIVSTGHCNCSTSPHTPLMHFVVTLALSWGACAYETTNCSAVCATTAFITFGPVSGGMSVQ
jgi:hypothetical protein